MNIWWDVISNFNLIGSALLCQQPAVCSSIKFESQSGLIYIRVTINMYAEYFLQLINTYRRFLAMFVFRFEDLPETMTNFETFSRFEIFEVKQFSLFSIAINFWKLNRQTKKTRSQAWFKWMAFSFTSAHFTFQTLVAVELIRFMTLIKLHYFNFIAFSSINCQK